MTKSEIRPLIESKKATLCALLSRNLPPDTSREQVEAIIDQEIFNLEYLTIFNPDFLECIPESFENTFRQMIIYNLSFDRDLGLLYTISRQAKIGDNYVKVLESKPTVNGDISIYKQCGSLLDLGEPKLEFDENGFLIKCVTELIIPKYDAGGNFIGEDSRSFAFETKDFKMWQKKSHQIKTSSKNPGNAKTMNLAGENYYNYAPLGKTLEGKDLKGNPPTPDSPGGINPSFAITKCTKHAIKRAKLGNNPYAKKFIYKDRAMTHRKYFDPADDDIREEVLYTYEAVKPVVPDFREDYEELKQTQMSPEPVVAPPPPIQKAPEIKPNATTNPYPNLTKEQVLKECNDALTMPDVHAIYNKYKSFIDSDDVLKKQVSKIGLAKNTPKQKEEAPNNDVSITYTVANHANSPEVIETKTPPKQISSDDL